MTPPRIPLADAPRLEAGARRVRNLRLALGTVLAALLAAAGALTAERAVADAGAARAETSTIAVLDLSGSISVGAYRRIDRTLTALARADGAGRHVGLVLFSDLAQEALPPVSRPRDLQPFLRYFRPLPRAGRDGSTLSVPYPANPWSASFSKGTAISTGLAAARRGVVRDRIGHARVLLLSDLADAYTDVARLKTELLAYARSPALELRVVPLPPPSADGERLVQRYVGQRQVLAGADLLPASVGGGGGTRFPLPLVAVVLLVAAALAAVELLTRPLRWREDAR